jgi:hypothetical protein
MSNPNSELQSAIDSRLASALEASNYRITLFNQKQNARLRLQKDLTYATGGGIFKIDQTLISFVSALKAEGYTSAVLLDVHQNPIEITDLAEFCKSIMQIYFECTNDFLVEFKSIQRCRTTSSLVGE